MSENVIDIEEVLGIRGKKAPEKAPPPDPWRPASTETANPWAASLVTVEPTWLTEKPKPRDYLMRDQRTGKGAIPARGVAVLGAAGGVGKSYATLQAAIAVATGQPWLGGFTPVRAGRVLVVSAEDPTDEVRRRLYEIARVQGVTTLTGGAIDISDVHDQHTPLLDRDGRRTDYARYLIDLAEARGPYALVIVDPVARLAGASIDADNAIATSLISTLEAVSTAARGLVVAAHHTNQTARRAKMADATALRGATGLGDGARLVMLLAAEDLKHGDASINANLGEIVTLISAKANHVRRWAPVDLRRSDHGVLLPLDACDRDLVAEARVGGSARKADARAKEETEQCAKEDAALLVILEKHPGIGAAEVRVQMRAALGSCADGRADVAVARALNRGQATKTRDGARVRHFLAGTGSE